MNKEEKYCFAFASLFSLEVKRKWISCSVDCFIRMHSGKGWINCDFGFLQ